MNSPPHEAKRQNPTTLSYDSLCSFIKNLLRRAMEVFPDEKWLHELLKVSEGQIPADHINGHGVDCRTIWQAVYFACRGHFYGESAEAIWAFINALGASTRQMTGPGRHDLMNVVFDFWNTRKVYDQGEDELRVSVDVGLYLLSSPALGCGTRRRASVVRASHGGGGGSQQATCH